MSGAEDVECPECGSKVGTVAQWGPDSYKLHPCGCEVSAGDVDV